MLLDKVQYLLGLALDKVSSRSGQKIDVAILQQFLAEGVICFLEVEGL